MKSLLRLAMLMAASLPILLPSSSVSQTAAAGSATTTNRPATPVGVPSSAGGPGQTAATTIVIERKFDAFGFPKAIPVSISGFSGEVDAALRFDLLFMGFTNVPPDQAQYLISGSDSGQLRAQVTDAINKQVRVNKVYSGGSLRAQAHAFADEVARTVAGEKAPIAQTRMAFCVRNGRNSEVYLADYDGHNPIAITRDGSSVSGISLAPGYRAILYGTWKLGPLQILNHDLTTGNRRTITPYSGSNMSPAVSPDGTRVAMVLSKGGSPDVYVANLDGSGLKQLTFTREDESSPCWSPDGRTICYSSREGGPAALYTVPAAGGRASRLTTTGVFGAATEPAWSPDGKWIAFTAQRSGGFDLCFVASTGGSAVRLVEGEDPAWAPNSRALAFVRRVSRRMVLSVLDVPTKQIKDVRQISGDNSQPCWGK
jgi:TolB protein